MSTQLTPNNLFLRLVDSTLIDHGPVNPKDLYDLVPLTEHLADKLPWKVDSNAMALQALLDLHDHVVVMALSVSDLGKMETNLMEGDFPGDLDEEGMFVLLKYQGKHHVVKLKNPDLHYLIEVTRRFEGARSRHKLTPVSLSVKTKDGYKQVNAGERLPLSELPAETVSMIRSGVGWDNWVTGIHIDEFEDAKKKGFTGPFNAKGLDKTWDGVRVMRMENADMVEFYMSPIQPAVVGKF